MIYIFYTKGISRIHNFLLECWIIILIVFLGYPAMNNGLSSLADKNNIMTRTSFFLLTPHITEQNILKNVDKMNDKNLINGDVNNDLSVTDTNNNDLLELMNSREPMYFGTENSTIVTTQIGATAHIPCTIHNIGDGVVSWIRRKDYHLLTVGLTTYSSDERFSATHLQHSEDWTLQIKFVQDRDAGTYECQVSTHPPLSIFLHLNVVEARAEIEGPPIKYLTPGSTLKLICHVIQSTEASAFIFWYHNNRMINHERGINVSSDADFHYSELTIVHATKDHSGNFTCVPSNSQPASVVVHIFKGDHPAAMYHEHRSSATKPYRDKSTILLDKIFYVYFVLFDITVYILLL